MVSPAKFGPYFWGALHLACLGGGDLKAFVDAFPSALPCGACGEHFKEVLQTFPYPEGEIDPLKLFMWSVDVHNVVNKRLDKPLVSYQEAFAFWTRPVESEKVVEIDWVTVALSIILSVLVITLVMKNLK